MSILLQFSSPPPQIGWVGGGNIEEITEEDWEGNEIVVGHDIKSKGIVLQTTDGGKSFAPKVIGANEAFRHLTFIDQNVGWAVASSNDNPWYLKRTVDGGESWKDVQLPSCPDGLEWMWLSKVVFPTPLKGWAAGSCGDPEYEMDNMSNKAVIVKTANAGSSWEFDPDAAMVVVADTAAPEKYYVFALSDPPEQVHEFDFPGQTALSQVTVSPIRFLATVQDGRLVLLGADSAGELSTVDVTPDNLTGLIPGQLDWSPDGAEVITTVDAGGKTNLMVIDVNGRTAKAITTSGNAAMPAWFGM